MMLNLLVMIFLTAVAVFSDCWVTALSVPLCVLLDVGGSCHVVSLVSQSIWRRS